MATRSRPTLHKRDREKARQKKHQIKLERRQEAKARRAAAPPRAPGEDPDIAGIRLGPQPPDPSELEDSEEPERE
jgi:hypothetical protein